jgi:hypothetical protein
VGGWVGGWGGGWVGGWVWVWVWVYALYICSGRVFYDLVAERKKRHVC